MPRADSEDASPLLSWVGQASTVLAVSVVVAYVVGWVSRVAYLRELGCEWLASHVPTVQFLGDSLGWFVIYLATAALAYTMLFVLRVLYPSAVIGRLRIAWYSAGGVMACLLITSLRWPLHWLTILSVLAMAAFSM